MINPVTMAAAFTTMKAVWTIDLRAGVVKHKVQAMITVRDLKEALEGIDENVEVRVCLVKPDAEMPIEEISESHEPGMPSVLLLHCDGPVAL